MNVVDAERLSCYYGDMQITLPGKTVDIDNAIAEAVYLVFGGVDAAAAALGISDKAIYKCLAARTVETRKVAERWEAATIAAGCKIPREEFIGWAPHRGPERHGDDDTGPRRRSSSAALAAVPRRTATAPSAGASASARARARRPRGTDCSTRLAHAA